MGKTADEKRARLKEAPEELHEPIKDHVRTHGLLKKKARERSKRR